jgi:RNA-directed DNA polymerase
LQHLRAQPTGWSAGDGKRHAVHHARAQTQLNETKSAVARPQERKFLGFSFTHGPEIKRTIAPKALERFKQRIREVTLRANGVSLETTIAELASYLRGWRSYFGFCETPYVLIQPATGQLFNSGW